MSSPETPLTIDDFALVPWQAEVAGIAEHNCWNYCNHFCAKVAETEQAGDDKALNVYRMLVRVTCIAFKLDTPDTPLGPPDRLDSIAEPELALLAGLVPDISDPEMRARVADILWLRNYGENGKRDYRMAHLAVTAYLASARRLEDPENWTHTVERVERAVQLAASLGRSPKNQPYVDVIAYVEEVLDRYQGDDPLFLSARMMELLQERQQGDPAKYAALAEKAARRAEREHVRYRAREYWERKARWHELAEDDEQRRAALIAAAETYISEGEDRIGAPRGGYLAATTFYQQGIEALRRIGGMQERAKDLQKILLAYQQKSVSEMGHINVEGSVENFDEYIARARAHVRERPLSDALLALALVTSSPSRVMIEQHVTEIFQKRPFLSIFPRKLVNERGRTQQRVPSSTSAEDGARTALESEMFSYAIQLRFGRVITSIEPAREQVTLDRNVRVRDFAPIVVNNPFVPPGREGIFARGLHAGLMGDFLVAAHLLIPQIEHSVRSALESQGVIVSGLEDDGTQPERGLNTTLAHPEAIDIFREDIVFDLRGLLVEKAGSNLRHSVAHGLVDERAFHTEEAAYVWWIALHLCVRVLLAQAPARAEGD